MTNQILTQEIIKEILDYDHETGIFTWKFRDRSHFNYNRTWRAWNSRFNGVNAGYAGKSKYLNIRIFGYLYGAHRLAWLYMNGEWPENQIDHINRNELDNRIINLRPVTARQNQHNRIDGCKYTGVSWNKRDSRWQSHIKISDKIISLGTFKTHLAACYARHQANINNRVLVL